MNIPFIGYVYNIQKQTLFISINESISKVDNLPGAMELQSDSSGDNVQFGLGYWVGGIILDLVEGDVNVNDGASIVQIAKASEIAPRYLNNHIKLKLFYHVPTTLKEYTGYTGTGDDPVVGANIGTSTMKKNEDGSNGKKQNSIFFWIILFSFNSFIKLTYFCCFSSFVFFYYLCNLFYFISLSAKRIVRFEVHPYSIKHVYDVNADKFDPKTVQTCTPTSKVYGDVGNGQNLILDVENEKGMKVVYSYGVEWINSPTSWATRWDIYLSMDGETHDDIHWLSITNSILVAIFLSALVALILVRTLRKDLMRYNRIPTDEEKAEELEESGWKLVHGDVFRPPSHPLLFSVTIGSGIQFFWMSFSTVTFAAMGFLSPANRGSFITAFLVLFVLLGAVGGFFSARMYKTLSGTGYQLTTLLTAFGFPGMLAAIFFIINLFVWGYGSSAAIPFTSMLAVCALWFGISVPLTFVGAFIGYGREPYEHPTRVNTLPRQIPEVPWYMTSIVSVLIGGILPFGTVSIELYFIMSSIWFGTTYYYVFGFLLVVGLLLFITLAEMSITLTYFQLCAEDYHWWWRSFWISGSCAAYVFLYSW